MAVVPRIPRFLFVIPGVLGGILVPAVIVTAPKPAPPHTVGMTNMDFSVDVVTLHRGQYLTFVDSSHNIHEVGPGQNGLILSPVRGEPMTGFHLMVTNAVYKTGPWLTPGTYHVTCAVHPMMNLTVVVVPLLRLLCPLAVRNPLTLFHSPLVRTTGEEEAMSSLKHLRYILGSLSAVMFSSAAAASV